MCRSLSKREMIELDLVSRVDYQALFKNLLQVIDVSMMTYHFFNIFFMFSFVIQRRRAEVKFLLHYKDPKKKNCVMKKSFKGLNSIIILKKIILNLF